MMDMMVQEDVLVLIEQMKYIVQKKKIPAELRCQAEELSDIQDAISYIANCFFEADLFLTDLAKGKLDVQTPNRQNFMAGSLKELQAGLRHLSWQANQVANGDYNQRVNFLGDFSDSFNKMIVQLAEREKSLIEQSAVLTESNNLMKAVMDGLKDWIIVTLREKGDIAYVNKSASQRFFSVETNSLICKRQCQKTACGFLQHLRSNELAGATQLTDEFKCEGRDKVYAIRSFLIRWNDEPAYAHYITDVTSEKQYQEQIETLAFKDELTGLYNRRFCYQGMQDMISSHAEFSFCLLDLDGLKYVNDNFGHSAGDDYLKTLAQEMIAVTRQSDILCRIGGDEFTILFPDCKEQAVENKMIQLNQKLKELSTEYPMSASYGVIYVEAESDLTVEEITALADDKMYEIKKTRKNHRL